MSGLTMVVLAYGGIWVIVTLYVARLARRLAAAERELRALGEGKN
jgi:CcmD family protein